MGQLLLGELSSSRFLRRRNLTWRSFSPIVGRQCDSTRLAVLATDSLFSWSVSPLVVAELLADPRELYRHPPQTGLSVELSIVCDLQCCKGYNKG